MEMGWFSDPPYCPDFTFVIKNGDIKPRGGGEGGGEEPVLANLLALLSQVGG